MSSELPRLILSASVMTEIRAIVSETPEGVETGVALLGARRDGCRTALHAVGPGPGSVQTPGYFAPDVDHLNREVRRLAETYPALEWIGSLHVHPFGMPQLSGTDRQTLSQLLGDAGLGLPDFVAGIIQRRGQRFAVYPYLADRDDPFPWLIPLEVCPDGAEAVSLAEAQVRLTPAAPAAPPVRDAATVPVLGVPIRVRLPELLAIWARRLLHTFRQKRSNSYEPIQ